MAKSNKNKICMNIFLLRSMNLFTFCIYFQVCYFLLEGITASMILNVRNKIAFILCCTFLVLQIWVLHLVELFYKTPRAATRSSNKFLFYMFIILLPLSAALLFSSSMSWIKLIYFLDILGLCTVINVKQLCSICAVTMISGALCFHYNFDFSGIELTLNALLFVHLLILIITHLAVYVFAKYLYYIKDKPLRALDYMDPYFYELEKKAILIRNNLAYYNHYTVGVNILDNFLFEEEIQHGVSTIKKVSKLITSCRMDNKDLLDVRNNPSGEFSDVNSAKCNSFNFTLKNDGPYDVYSSLKNWKQIHGSSNNYEKTTNNEYSNSKKNTDDYYNSTSYQKGENNNVFSNIKNTSNIKATGKSVKTTDMTNKSTNLQESSYTYDINKEGSQNNKQESYNKYLFPPHMQLPINQNATKHGYAKIHNAKGPNNDIRKLERAKKGAQRIEIVKQHISLFKNTTGKNNKYGNILLREMKKKIRYVYFDKKGFIKKSHIIPLYVFDRHNVNKISTYLESDTSKKLDIYHKYYTFLSKENTDNSYLRKQIYKSMKDSSEIINDDDKKTFSSKDGNTHSMYKTFFTAEDNSNFQPTSSTVVPIQSAISNINNLGCKSISYANSRHSNNAFNQHNSNVTNKFSISSNKTSDKHTSSSNNFNMANSLSNNMLHCTSENGFHYPMLSSNNNKTMNELVIENRRIFINTNILEDIIKKNYMHKIKTYDNDARLFYTIRPNILNENLSNKMEEVRKEENNVVEKKQEKVESDEKTEGDKTKIGEACEEQEQVKKMEKKKKQEKIENDNNVNNINDKKKNRIDSNIKYVAPINYDLFITNTMSSYSSNKDVYNNVELSLGKNKKNTVSEASSDASFAPEGVLYIDDVSNDSVDSKQTEEYPSTNTSETEESVSENQRIFNRIEKKHTSKVEAMLNRENFVSIKNANPILQKKKEKKICAFKCMKLQKEKHEENEKETNKNNDSFEEEDKLTLRNENTENTSEKACTLKDSFNLDKFKSEELESSYLNNDSEEYNSDDSEKSEKSVQINDSDNSDIDQKKKKCKYIIQVNSQHKKKKWASKSLNFLKFLKNSNKIDPNKKYFNKNVKSKIYEDINFSVFYDSISTNHYYVPENADKTIYDFNLKRYLFSFKFILNVCNAIKQLVNRIGKHNTHWRRYQKVLYISQWGEKVIDMDIDQILKYKNFMIWYKHWVKNIVFHSYKKCSFLTLILLLLNVVSIYLQTNFFFFLLKQSDMWNKTPVIAPKNQTIKLGDNFYNFGNLYRNNINFNIFRVLLQAIMHIMFMIPYMMVQNYKKLKILNIFAILHIILNMVAGIIDITYIMNSEIYNVGVLYTSAKIKNIFDLFLIGKLVTSIFITPIVLNFEEPKTTIFVTLSTICYLFIYYFYLPPIAFTMRLIHITKFGILIFFMVSAIYYSRAILKSRKILFIKYALPYFIYLTFLNADPAIKAKLIEEKKKEKQQKQY